MITSKIARGAPAVGRINRGVVARHAGTTRVISSMNAAHVQLNRAPTMGEHRAVVTGFKRDVLQREEVRNDLAYCLSFAPSDESSDFANNLVKLFPDERMKQQLEISKDQLRVHDIIDARPLPKTLEDALRPSRRAIVITEAKAPFRVFDVNKAWEQLCGYSHVESRGKTLGSLLRGPETDQLAATGLITQLMQGEEAGATLTNYKKTGHRFRNRIRVGPLYNDGEITHFVGILQEVHDGL